MVARFIKRCVTTNPAMGLVATQWQSANYFFLVRVRDPFWTSIWSFDLIKEWLLNNVSMINNSCKIEKCDNQRQSYRVMTIKKERRNQINKKNQLSYEPISCAQWWGCPRGGRNGRAFTGDPRRSLEWHSTLHLGPSDENLCLNCAPWCFADISEFWND